MLTSTGGCGAHHILWWDGCRLIVKGLATSLKTLLWIAVLLIIVIYACAILYVLEPRTSDTHTTPFLQTSFCLSVCLSSMCLG